MYELLPSIHLIELVSLPEIAELKTVFWTIGLILFIFQHRHWVSRSSDNLGCLFKVGRDSSDIWNFSFFWQDFKFAFKWLDLHLFLFLLFHRSKNEWVFKQWHNSRLHLPFLCSFLSTKSCLLNLNKCGLYFCNLSQHPSKYLLWYQRGTDEERRWLWLLLRAHQSPLEFLPALKRQHNQKAKGLWSQENLSVDPKSSIYNQCDFGQIILQAAFLQL